MASHLKARRFTKVRQFRSSAARGNVLVYVVMVMVIFGLLGVTMISLFSTSVSSSATRNDTRRAAYLSESGIRYAISELRTGDFSKTTITNLNKNNNNTDYKISPTETFSLNIFSPWFEPTTAIDISAGGNNTETVEIKEGKLPDGFIDSALVGLPSLTVVNYDYIDLGGGTNPPGSARATITGGDKVSGESKKLKLEITDDGSTEGFVAGNNETLCFAVKPVSDQNVSLPGSLQLEPVAARVFPAVGGSFQFKRHNFYYEKAINHGTYVELIGVKPVAGETQNSINAVTTDYVILSPRNRFILSEGKSGDVTFGNNMKYATGISDISIVPPKSRKPDIDFEEEPALASKLSQVSPNPNFITVDNTDRFLRIGGGSGPSFGAVWFNDTRSIGGQRNFCSTGACQFGLGIRAFFTFNTTGDNGEGVIFALTNGQDNSIGSAGGDIQRSELLGYAGDSRLTNPIPPTSPAFLDGAGKGLQSPKIGLEFDTRVNYSPAFEQYQKYCSGNDLNENTRNDPLSSDKHAIQYVFWAKDSLSLPCRNTPGRTTYDDNRHDAIGLGSPNWTKNLSGSTKSDPVIRSSDGTIYIGSAANSLFAVKPDGTEKWTFGAPTGEVFSPVLGGGKIFFNSADNKVYAVNSSDGQEIWDLQIPGLLTEKPAVDNDYVYVSADNYLFKLNVINGGLALLKIFSTANLTSPPVLSLSEQILYIGFNDGRLHARKTSDLEEVAGWPSASIGSITGSPTVDKNTGFIYVSTENGVYKINPASPTTSPTQFPNPGGTNPTSSPTLSKDGLTVYVGFSNGRLYALNTSDLTPSLAFNNPNGFFPTSGSIGTSVATPEVDDNENIYVGSNNNFVYALYADGSVKWEFDTGGAVRSKPAVDQNGTVYVGSNSSGGQLWAINQFAEPRNYRQNFENPPKPELAQNLVAYSDSKAVNPYFTSISNTNKWFKDGPWAMRIEVDRVPLTGDRAEYTLRSWVQQCTDTDCTNVRGTFFEDTRTRYNPIAKPPNLVQSFELDSTLNLKFNTFLFGFTSAKRDSSDDQLITIDNFQLSFIRPGDPEVIIE